MSWIIGIAERSALEAIGGVGTSRGHVSASNSAELRYEYSTMIDTIHAQLQVIERLSAETTCVFWFSSQGELLTAFQANFIWNMVMNQRLEHMVRSHSPIFETCRLAWKNTCQTGLSQEL